MQNHHLLGCSLRNGRMISVHFQDKPCNNIVIQVHALTSKPKEAEVEWFYEDLQDLPELTLKKDILFIIGDWNAKVGSEEIPVAAAAAKSLQSCLTLCDPIDSSPPGSPIPGILQARTLEWVTISFFNA